MTLFERNGKSLQAIQIDDWAWALASDVCGLVELKNVGDVLSRLPDKWKKHVRRINIGSTDVNQSERGNPYEWLIAEPGIYQILIRRRDPKYQEWVDWVLEDVLPTLRKTGHYETSAYKARKLANSRAVPIGYFSVVQEFGDVIDRLESLGVILPSNLLPDSSVGRMFCHRLRKHGVADTDSLPEYHHIFPETGKVVTARLYPDELLPIFRKFKWWWLAEHGPKYFKSRAPEVVTLLEARNETT